MRKTLNILIIDDEQNNRELISMLLEKFFHLEYNIENAENYQLAENALNQNQYDVIFSDSKIPFQTEKTILNSIENKFTQLVLTTALNAKEFENKISKPVFFLQKPIDIDDFKMVCNLILENLKAQQKMIII